MYDHLGLKVQDLAASIAFYSAALKPLGFALCSQDAGGAGFGPQGAAALWLYAGRSGQNPGTHVAFKATSRAAVEGFHQAGLKAGGRENGKPGLRADYSPTYYAAFLVDPDGNNVEAVWMG